MTSRQVVKGLKPIYTAINPDQTSLEESTPSGALSCRASAECGERLAARHPFVAVEPEIRQVIYSTNTIEALNRQLHDAIKVSIRSRCQPPTLP
jgi:transposase-like protein